MTDSILLTGATGFVGSAVARVLLARGHRLRLLVRSGGDRRNIAGLDTELIDGDLRQPDLAPLLAGCTAVVHCAADYRVWVPNPAPMLEANVAGTRRLLQAALAAGLRRVVYCSSVAALGLTGDDTPADETTPVNVEKIAGVYKRSKYLAEQEVLALVARGLPAVIVNPAGPVGPRDIKPTPTGRMIADAAAGRMPAYVDTGLNIVHVDDVAEGHALALEHGRVGERYILGSENLYLREILALVAEVAGGRPPFVKLNPRLLWPLAMGFEAVARLTGIEPLVTRDHLRMAQKIMFFSNDKARRELGFAPRPARAAIADAVAWFRANGTVSA